MMDPSTPAGTGPGNLVRNPSFQECDPAGTPLHWQFKGPAWAEACVGYTTSTAATGRARGLVFHGREGASYATGRVEQTVRNLTGGRPYAIQVNGRLQSVESPFRKVLVRIIWLQDGRPLHPAGTLLPGPWKHGDEGFVFRGTLQSPPEADAALLSLEVRMLGPKERVVWTDVRMSEASPIPPRPVGIGTVWFVPRSSTPDRNRNLFAAFLDEAGERELDIVCLPEGLTVVGTGMTYAECAESVPGPTTDILSERARRNRLWVVAGLYEADGPDLYNTAVLIDRDGNIAGTYRKTHLPREEWRQGIRPGLEYPVFRTDFGIIGIQICYDWFFPEVTEILALNGAEIIFAPTWGNTWPDADGRVEGETTFRVRARDNGVWMVPSVYSGNSLIIDPLGRILTSSNGRDGLFSATVDLNERGVLPFVGCWRDIGPRDRMPDTYGPLTEPHPFFPQ